MVALKHKSCYIYNPLHRLSTARATHGKSMSQYFPTLNKAKWYVQPHEGGRQENGGFV